MNMSLNHDNLEIGQVLYIVSDKETRVVPVVVSEQATIKTLEGNTTTWKVILGPKEKRKTVPLESLKGDKFFSLDEAKESILSSFVEFLNQAVEKSQNDTRSWYGLEVESLKTVKTPKKNNVEEDQFDADSFLDVIENKSPAIKASSLKADMMVDSMTEVRFSDSDSAEVRRAKIRAMAQVPEEEGDVLSGTTGSSKKQKVILPGGEEVFVTVD
jgi:hypothetical protein